MVNFFFYRDIIEFLRYLLGGTRLETGDNMTAYNSTKDVLGIFEIICTNMPEEWALLTTHRLDIYDESQAKSQFLEQLSSLIEKNEVTADALAELPTAFDYVRLGHQLSSILEWGVSEVYDVAPTQVISFASTTMPLMAILRSDAVQSRGTIVYHDGSLPEVLMRDEVNSLYGYSFETHQVQTSSDIGKHPDQTVVWVSKAPLLSPTPNVNVDCTVNLSSRFGSVLVLHHTDTGIDTGIAKQWVSEIQHVRRRECIASTPPYTVRMIQELLGQTPDSMETVLESDWKSIEKAVFENSGASIRPLVATSGLSTQYAIMMGLLDFAKQTHPNKPIQFLIPPNCYGGTNDQARRVATMVPGVRIVDLPVDSGHSMTTSLERRLIEAAELDAVPFVLVEIPTNPRVEVPDMAHLQTVLTTPRSTPNGEKAVVPVFIVDQTFCPNVRLLDDVSPLRGVQTLSYVSGSKFPSGGRCTAGYVTANDKGAPTMPYLAKHLQICDNQATPLQLKVLAEMMPSMQERIAVAYGNTQQFVQHIRRVLPNTRISFIDHELVDLGFTPSVFSLDLPTTGKTAEDREEFKRQLNLRLISHMVDNFPTGAKHCVSYGQLSKSYWTVPATSTQGTTKESDKDYIVRIAMPPEMDMEVVLNHFDQFCVKESLYTLSI